MSIYNYSVVIVTFQVPDVTILSVHYSSACTCMYVFVESVIANNLLLLVTRELIMILIA